MCIYCRKQFNISLFVKEKLKIKLGVKIDTFLSSEELANLHWNKYHELKLIPEKFTTIEMIQYAFNINKCFDKFIKKDFKFISSDMVMTCYDLHGIKKIPDEFLSKNIIEKEFDKNGIENIKSEFICEKMLIKNGEKEYLKSVYHFMKINKRFLNYEMCKEFFDIYQEILKNMEDFLTNEMIINYWKMTKGEYAFDLLTKNYLLNQTICDEFWDKTTQRFELIPNHFKTFKMIKEFIEISENLDVIDILKNLKINQEIVDIIWKKYDKTNKIYDNIPQKFLSNEIIEEYFNIYKNINNIPIDKITDEIIFKYIETYNNIPFKNKPFLYNEQLIIKIIDKFDKIDLKTFPPSILCKNIIKYFFLKHRKIRQIPEIYLTQEFFQEIYNETGNKRGFPKIFNGINT